MIYFNNIKMECKRLRILPCGTPDTVGRKKIINIHPLVNKLVHLSVQYVPLGKQ